MKDLETTPIKVITDDLYAGIEYASELMRERVRTKLGEQIALGNSRFEVFADGKRFGNNNQAGIAVANKQLRVEFTNVQVALLIANAEDILRRFITRLVKNQRDKSLLLSNIEIWYGGDGEKPVRVTPLTVGDRMFGQNDFIDITISATNEKGALIAPAVNSIVSKSAAKGNIPGKGGFFMRAARSMRSKAKLLKGARSGRNASRIRIAVVRTASPVTRYGESIAHKPKQNPGTGGRKGMPVGVKATYLPVIRIYYGDDR